MSPYENGAARRADGLLRWYPRAWRSRYGDEFRELLIADIAEMPRSRRRTIDIARSGVVARLGLGGLTHQLEPSQRVSASLASLGCAVAGFLVAGIAMWSQLTIGWQWSRPDTSATTAAIVLMSCLLLVFATLAVLATVPFGWAVVARIAEGRMRGLVGPLGLLVAGLSTVIVGGWHFAAGWPGTGGHPWAHQHLVPGAVAAFAWASTLSISSYWAHPSALLSFPAGELAWMAVSPVAMACFVVGVVKTVRTLDLSPRGLRFEARLARIACGAMVVFIAGSCCWIVVGGSGPRNLFHAGVIDLAALAVMIAALVMAGHASNRVRDGLAFVAD